MNSCSTKTLTSEWGASQQVKCIFAHPIDFLILISQDHLFPWATASKGFWCSENVALITPSNICDVQDAKSLEFDVRWSNRNSVTAGSPELNWACMNLDSCTKTTFFAVISSGWTTLQKYETYEAYCYRVYFGEWNFFLAKRMGPPPIVTGISPREGPPGTRWGSGWLNELMYTNFSLDIVDWQSVGRTSVLASKTWQESSSMAQTASSYQSGRRTGKYWLLLPLRRARGTSSLQPSPEGLVPVRYRTARNDRRNHVTYNSGAIPGFQGNCWPA